MSNASVALTQAATALTISTAIGAVVTGSILLLSLVSFWEHRGELSFKNPAKRWRVPLLACVSFSFLVFCLDGSTVWHTWRLGEEESCKHIATLITLTYVFEKQALSLFLYDRAKIVHTSITLGPQKDRLLMYLRWILFLTLTVGIPICFYWAPFVAFDGDIAAENGKCVYFTRMPAVPLAFVIADSMLALGMLLIFIAPLYQHKLDVERVASTAPMFKINTRSLDKMIKSNIYLSALAVTSGCIGLIGVAVFNWLYDGSPSNYHLPTWGLFVISWDNLFATLAVHSMTPKWLPSKLVKYLKRSGGSSRGTGDEKGSVMTPTTSPSQSKKAAGSVLSQQDLTSMRPTKENTASYSEAQVSPYTGDN